MDILEQIKKRTTIRKYKKKKIPQKTIKKIIQAGIWSSSIHGFQPWRYMVITKKELLNNIAKIILEKSHTINSGIGRILALTSRTIENAPLLVVVYSGEEFANTVQKFFKIKKSYIKIANATEMQAVSASIQNMILTASENGIGSCWNTIPLFCEKEINNLLKRKEKLIGLITMGYPDEKAKRSLRKPLNEKIEIIK